VSPGCSPLIQRLAFAVRALSAVASTMSSSIYARGSSAGLMPVIRTAVSKVTYPTGNKSFSVMQAFPAAISEEESDPFLMCDHFGPTVSRGLAAHSDDFDVPW
jgi:hypothetical protein